MLLFCLSALGVAFVNIKFNLCSEHFANGENTKLTELYLPCVFSPGSISKPNELCKVVLPICRSVLLTEHIVCLETDLVKPT